MANRMKNLGKLGRMLDGIRQSVSTAPKTECDIEESLRSEHFQVSKVNIPANTPKYIKFTVIIITTNA